MKKLIALFLIFVTVLALVGCGNKQPIACDFQFVHPETGEIIKQGGTMSYEDIYLTYDGTQKNIEVITARRDNGKRVYMCESIDVTYTYENEKIGKKEYGKPYMLEKGKYYLCINDCKYDDDKYFISTMGVTLTIYLQ